MQYIFWLQAYGIKSQKNKFPFSADDANAFYNTRYCLWYFISTKVTSKNRIFTYWSNKNRKAYSLLSIINPSTETSQYSQRQLEEAETYFCLLSSPFSRLGLLQIMFKSPIPLHVFKTRIAFLILRRSRRSYQFFVVRDEDRSVCFSCSVSF